MNWNIPILKFLNMLTVPSATPPIPLYQLLSNPLRGKSTKSVIPIRAYFSKLRGDPITPTEKGSLVASCRACFPKKTISSKMKSC